MTDTLVERIPEEVLEGKRLGRHVEHDPRSRDYAYESTGAQLVGVIHRRFGRVLDQGDVGSCTGNAVAGAVNTIPLHKVGQRNLDERDALDIYEKATHIDHIPGSYPPDDTGSSGLAAAHAAKNQGLISSYKHAFSMNAALAALQTFPVITGVVWYEGFDSPDADGVVKIAGQIRGGHEFEIIGFELGDDTSSSMVVAENSWGLSYGLRGIFRFTVKTWQKLLDLQGDVTILVPNTGA